MSCAHRGRLPASCVESRHAMCAISMSLSSAASSISASLTDSEVASIQRPRMGIASNLVNMRRNSMNYGICCLGFVDESPRIQQKQRYLTRPSHQVIRPEKKDQLSIYCVHIDRLTMKRMSRSVCDILKLGEALVSRDHKKIAGRMVASKSEIILCGLEGRVLGSALGSVHHIFK